MDSASEAVGAVVDWLRANPVEPGDLAVPGATENQLGSLAALGPVAHALLASESPVQMPSGLVRWMQGRQLPPELLVPLRRAAASDHELLARLYCALLPSTGRRVLGTFFTPEAVVREMVDLAALLVGAPSAVIDPGAGVGAFTGAALQRWRNAVVHAVDLNVVTLGLLAARCATLTNRQRARVRLHHQDYLTWIGSWRPDGPTLTIGNPPYTRHQLLTAQQKDAGLSASGALLSNRNSTLAGYMVAATLGRLRASDGVVLLLPANWMHANYASTMREWLWKRTAREVEVRLLQDPGLFPDANITASVLAVGPVRPKRAATNLRLDLGASAKIVSPPERLLNVPVDWRVYGKPNLDSGVEMSTVALADIFRVRRGAATGANQFFVVDAATAERLSSQWVVRAASRLHTLDDDVLDESAHDRMSKSGARCWLLRIPLDADTASMEWYLKEGRSAGVPETYLAKQRPAWWSVEQLTPPSVLLQPMTKHRFRVVVNAVQAFHTNTLYGLYPNGLRPKAIDAVVSWLRSDAGQTALRSVARPLSSGLLRVEPKAVGAIRLPRLVADGLAGALVAGD